MTRVKARTPGVKAESAWSKQMESSPSAPQAFCVAVRVSGENVAGTNAVAVTPDQTAIVCAMVCSISVRWPEGV